MEQEVDTLLRKEAIEVVPPHERESGVYSRYFVVQKKDGGLRLNHSVMRLKFKTLTLRQVVSQIRSEDWFVMIDLKDVYFHISIFPTHRKFLRFAFGGEAYQYLVLPFVLALSPRTFIKCVDAALEPLIWSWCRIRPRCKHVCHLLGLSHSSAVARVRGDQSLTVKRFQRLPGLMAAASNVIPIGLLYMRPLQWWLKTRVGFLRGNLLRMIKVTRRCLHAINMWRQPRFLSQGPMLGAPCHA